jgi:predicted rRNA methylase YqxC with S4 and FtsJ domains
VAEKIRRDDRVSVMERTNLRYLSELPQKVDLVTLDLSFISILLVSFQTVVNIFSVAIFKVVFDWLFSSSPLSICMGRI